MAKEPQAIDFKVLLHKVNLRDTPARLALLRVLHNTGSPQTHAYLADTLEDLGIDKATVFRNLNSLVEIGLVRRLDVGDHVWRYEWLGEKQDSEHLHPHFVCTSCGEVDCLETDQVRFNDRSKRDLAKRTSEIVLRGTCKNCDQE